MQAHLLAPEQTEYAESVARLTHNIGLTDYGVGPHPADYEKERRHLLAEKMKAGGWGAAEWAAEEEPASWYRRPAAETAPLSLPYTALHALELAIHTHHLDARVLTKGRLIIHVAGSTSEHEGAADFKVCGCVCVCMQWLDVLARPFRSGPGSISSFLHLIPNQPHPTTNPIGPLRQAPAAGGAPRRARRLPRRLWALQDHRPGPAGPPAGAARLPEHLPRQRPPHGGAEGT